MDNHYSVPHTVIPSLKPCPFCGGSPGMSFSEDETSYAGHASVWYARMSCEHGCCEMREESPDQQEAALLVAKRWNKRFRPKPKSQRTMPAWKTEGFRSEAAWNAHHLALEGKD